MKLVLKFVAIAVLATGTFMTSSANSLNNEPGGGGSCCANYCGDDAVCYKWCIKFGSSGPCPTTASHSKAD